MRCIHDYLFADFNAFRLCYVYRFVDKHIQQIHIFEPHPAELTQCAGFNDLVFRGKSQEVFVRHIIHALIDKIHIGQAGDAFYHQVLEHPYRIFGHTAIIRTIPVVQLIVDKGEVNKFVD